MPNPYDAIFGGGQTAGNPYDSIFGGEETEEERRRREMLERLRRNRQIGLEQEARLDLPRPSQDIRESPAELMLDAGLTRLGSGLMEAATLPETAAQLAEQPTDFSSPVKALLGSLAKLSPGAQLARTLPESYREGARERQEVAEQARDYSQRRFLESGLSPLAATLAGEVSENVDLAVTGPLAGLKAGRAGARSLARFGDDLAEAAGKGMTEGARAGVGDAATAARRTLRPVPKAGGESLATEILPAEAMAHAASASSPEAISRMRGGTRFYEVSPGGEVRPMIGVEAVDTAPRKGYAKVRVSANGEVVVEEGRLSAAGQKAVASEAAQARKAPRVADEAGESVYELPSEGDESFLAALGVEPGAGVQKLAQREQRAARELPGATGVAPEQRRPPWEMSPGELDEAIGATEASSRSVEESLFGVEGAKRYDRLHRKANSSYDRKGADAAYEELQRMESSLTEPQRNRLFGIGEDVYDGDELKLYREAISKVDSWGSGSPDELGASLQWAVTRLGDEVDPARMTLDERLAWVQMRRAFEVAQEKGWSTGDVSRAAYRHGASRFSDPSDVEAMFGRFRDPLGPSGPPAVRAAQPVEAVESVAERGQRLLTQPPPPKLSPRAELSVKVDPEGGHVATEGLSDWLVKNFVGGAGSVDARGNVYQMVARDFLDPRIRRYLGQELPRRVERAGGETMADLRTMAVLSKKIDKASAHYAKSTGGRMSASQVRRQMDEARRAGDYSGLPPELQQVAQESGGFVDRLSREYIDSGLAAAEETAETISNRLGRYLNTSHAAFDRPGFLAEVRGTKAWDEARSFFKTQIPDASEEEIVGLMEALADRKQGRPMGFGKRGGVGRKDLSNLVRQEEIPEPVRELLGVYRDYRVNFERTTAKMAHALAEHRLLRDVAEELKALGVVREPSEVTGRGTAGYYREIVGGPERSPLAGTFTTPRVAEVLEGVMEASRSTWFTQLSGLVKMGKVALSPQTQARNWLSGFAMTAANGNLHRLLLDPRRLVRTAQVQKAMIGQSKGGTNNRLLRFLGAADEEVLEAEIQRSMKLGVVGRGANGREFLSYLDDVGQAPRGVRALAENKPMKFVSRAYLAGDDFWKFANWKVEADRLRNIYDGRIPDEAIEREAAEIVSQQMQTYDRAIPVARKLSRNPLLSPFVTFSAEMPRNLVNIYRRSGLEFGRAKEALAAGRPQEAWRWAQAATSRLTGAGVALTSWGAWKTYKARENGITGDKEEAFRRLALPDYLENSQAVILEVDGDEVTYFDSQFADPYAVVQKIWVSAVARPGDPAERMARAADEMAGTFLGPEVLAGTLAGAAFGRDFRTDREITRSSRPPGQQLADRAAYVGWGLAPGGAITAKRVAEAAIAGDQERVGREAIAVAGPRISTVNLRDGFRYRVLDFNRARQEISSDFRVNSTDRDGNPKPPEAKLKAQQQAEESWQRNYRKIQGFVTDGKNWGWSDREMFEELRASGVRKDLARALVDERTMTWQQYRRAL